MISHITAVALALATSATAPTVTVAAGPKVSPTPTPAAAAAPAATPAPASPWTPASSASSTSSTSTTPAATAGTDSGSITGGIMGPAHQENMSYRPEGMSVGIGAGWTFPSDLGTPNTVTARFRMESGLTLEPGIQLDANIANQKVAGAKADSTTINFIVGSAIRKPVMSRNQVDVVGILTPAIAFTSTSGKDATGAKTSSSGFGIGTGWGIGVEYWPRTHWSLSFNALNPLLNLSSSSTKDAAGVKTDTTQIFLGADFNPTVQLLTHVYY